jgi:RNA polymerase sigma-54 factor
VDQKLHLKLAQRLVMTPTLQQAIKLLQLSRLELEQSMAQEAEANPLLETADQINEEEETTQDAAAAQPDEDAVAASQPADDEPSTVEASEAAFEEVELDALFGNYLHDSPTVAPAWEDDADEQADTTPATQASAFETLCGQLRLQSVAPELVAVCEFIIGNLDGDGYLRATDDELAEQLGVAAAEIRKALAVVQALEPAGIAARSLQECFRLQLRRRSDGGDPDVIGVALRILEDGFDDLLHQRWEKLTARLGVSRAKVAEVVAVLRHLDPRPGGQLGPSQNVVVEPDVVVAKVDGAWVVSLNDDGLPRLRISAGYARLIKSPALTSDARGFLRERFRSALWFLRSVEQRQTTVLRVARAIVRRQEEFLDKGLASLRPLVLRDIANDIGMHESTVSRVVTNKYMATPRGVFALKFFFHSSISHAVSGDISSVVVKERIRELIAEEDAARPLSDARIARQLNRLGIRIARRTVAKYREETGLPSSEQRRAALLPKREQAE